MTDLFNEALEVTLKHEGGYVNDPDDRGGETNMGITVAVARAAGYTGKMKTLPLKIAAEIYKKQYWDKLNLDTIARRSPELAKYLFDAGVNCGTGRAAEWLQRALNLFGAQLNVDSSIGPKTLQAFVGITSSDAALLYHMVRAERLVHYMNLAQLPSQQKFIRGWLNRSKA